MYTSRNHWLIGYAFGLKESYSGFVNIQIWTLLVSWELNSVKFMYGKWWHAYLTWEDNVSSYVVKRLLAFRCSFFVMSKHVFRGTLTFLLVRLKKLPKRRDSRLHMQKQMHQSKQLDILVSYFSDYCLFILLVSIETFSEHYSYYENLSR